MEERNHWRDGMKLSSSSVQNSTFWHSANKMPENSSFHRWLDNPHQALHVARLKLYQLDHRLYWLAVLLAIALIRSAQFLRKDFVIVSQLTWSPVVPGRLTILPGSTTWFSSHSSFDSEQVLNNRPEYPAESLTERTDIQRSHQCIQQSYPGSWRYHRRQEKRQGKCFCAYHSMRSRPWHCE